MISPGLHRPLQLVVPRDQILRPLLQLLAHELVIFDVHLGRLVYRLAILVVLLDLHLYGRVLLYQVVHGRQVPSVVDGDDLRLDLRQPRPELVHRAVEQQSLVRLVQSFAFYVGKLLQVFPVVFQFVQPCFYLAASEMLRVYQVLAFVDDVL